LRPPPRPGGARDPSTGSAYKHEKQALLKRIWYLKKFRKNDRFAF